MQSAVAAKRDMHDGSVHDSLEPWENDVALPPCNSLPALVRSLTEDPTSDLRKPACMHHPLGSFHGLYAASSYSRAETCGSPCADSPWALEENMPLTRSPSATPHSRSLVHLVPAFVPRFSAASQSCASGRLFCMSGRVCAFF